MSNPGFLRCSQEIFSFPGSAFTSLPKTQSMMKEYGFREEKQGTEPVMIFLCGEEDQNLVTV